LGGGKKEIFALLGCYAALIGSYLPTFRDCRSVTSLMVSGLWHINMGPIGCPETSVINYQSTLRNIPEERRSLFTPRRKLEITQKYNIFWGK